MHVSPRGTICVYASLSTLKSGRMEYARMQRSNVAYFVVRASWVRYSDYGLSPPLVWEASLDSDQ